ncbi:MAG: substrate-binding periplasmic protein [Kordiimonas sp.]
MAALAVTCCVLAAVSQPTTAAPLLLATRHHLPPYVYNEANSGIEIDLIKAIFKDMGTDISFIQMPRIRMIQSFDRGEVQGILTQNITASNVGCATEWNLQHQNVGFTLADEDIKLTTLNDLGHLSVLSFDGARRYLGESFRRAVDNNPLYEESINQASHIELVYLKRFNVIVGDEWILRLAQRNHFDRTGTYKKMTAHYIMPPSLYSARFHDQKTCDAFDASLQKLRSSGNYEQIVSAYHQQIMIAATAGY